MKVYVGSAGGVVMFEVDTCHRYTTQHCMSCHKDPYCTWNSNNNKCIKAASNDYLVLDDTAMEEKCRLGKEKFQHLRIFRCISRAVFCK